MVLDANGLCGVVVDADSDLGLNTGFTFDGITFEDSYASSIFLQGSGHLFRNNLVQNNGVDNFDHGLYHSASDSIIENNTFFNNFGYGVQQYCSGCGTANDNIYRNNIFKANGTAGLLVSDGFRTLVYNNISINDGDISVDAWGGLRAYDGGNDTKFYNNTVYASGGAGIVIQSGVTGTIVQNNILYLNTSPISGTPATQSNNLTTNPNFV